MAPEPSDGRTPAAGITREAFGEVDGQAVERFTLTNEHGMRAAILSYGGIIQALEVPDRQGRMANVVLGFRTLEEYIDQSSYHGAVIGRFANRIANARFTLDGTDYALPPNNGAHAVHGGRRGFDRHVWEATIEEIEDNPHAPFTLALHRVSPDGEEGFPGTLDVTVRYTWMGTGLQISYSAIADAPTVLNLTNHAYFNLAGEGNGSINGHVLQIRASHYLPVGDELIPTGETASVAGTPLDFTAPHRIGERIRASHQELARGGGYNHHFVFDSEDELGFRPSWQVRLADPDSGRLMHLQTDEPGMQLYTGNLLDGSQVGASGQRYERHAGVCLETQHAPDSPNQPAFPSTVLRPGESFWSHTSFQFGVIPDRA